MTVGTLVLLRHAKAERIDDRTDIERPLTARGHRDAGAAGTWLAAQDLRPDLVLCSPAVRTRQTWHDVAMALAEADPSGGGPEVRYEATLYDGGRTELVDLLRAVPDSIGTVLVIGHNPTISDVSVLLRPDRRVTGGDELPTCGLAVHRPSGPWSATEPGSAEMIRQHTARG
jgi:phosphohistidine phosphatase